MDWVLYDRDLRHLIVKRKSEAMNPTIRKWFYERQLCTLVQNQHDSQCSRKVHTKYQTQIGDSLNCLIPPAITKLWGNEN